MQHFDIIIIEAGPARSCLARLVSNMPGLHVALLDARQLDVPYTGTGRIKSCGGLMAPDAPKTLACMDMTIPSHLLVTPQLFAVRTLYVQSGLERYYQRFYLNLDRETFDRWLFASVSDRVHKFTSTTVKSLAEDSEGYAVTCENGKVCLLGEAGGFISPSSAEGFSYAFRTALTLYRSLCKTRLSPASADFFVQVCRLHTQLLRPLRLVLCTKIVKQQILYNPLLRRGIMRSGLQALHRIEENHQ